MDAVGTEEPAERHLDPAAGADLVRVGIGVTVSMLVAVIGYGLLRTVYLDSLPGPGKHEAGAVIYDTLTRYVERGFKVVLVVGILVWLCAWLAGPSRPAQAVRNQWNRMIGKAGGTVGEIGPVNEWVGHHLGLLRGLLLGMLGVVLITWERPTGKVVLLLVAVGLVGCGLIQLLAAGVDREPTVADA